MTVLLESIDFLSITGHQAVSLGINQWLSVSSHYKDALFQLRMLIQEPLLTS